MFKISNTNFHDFEEMDLLSTAFWPQQFFKATLMSFKKNE